MSGFYGSYDTLNITFNKNPENYLNIEIVYNRHFTNKMNCLEITN